MTVAELIDLLGQHEGWLPVAVDDGARLVPVVGVTAFDIPAVVVLSDPDGAL